MPEWNPIMFVNFLNDPTAIGTHLSGTVALTYFVFDDWDCDLFWWVFSWCSAVPAAIELLNLFSAFIVRHASGFV